MDRGYYSIIENETKYDVSWNSYESDPVHMGTFSSREIAQLVIRILELEDKFTK